jgi:hypothetical protein
MQGMPVLFLHYQIPVQHLLPLPTPGRVSASCAEEIKYETRPYENKFYTVIVLHSTNINKTNNYLSL